MQTIRQDLNSIGIKLDLSKATKTLDRLLELTHDRKTWRSIVKRVFKILTYNHHLEAVAYSHVVPVNRRLTH